MRRTGKIRSNDTARLLWTALAVAIVVMLAVFVDVALVPARYTAWILSKWARFAVLVGFSLWYQLKAYWKLRKTVAFWFIFLGVFGLYLLGVGHFFYVGNGVSLVTFALAAAAEFLCLALPIHWVLGVGPTDVNLNL